jgi:hypothetical protein
LRSVCRAVNDEAPGGCWREFQPTYEIPGSGWHHVTLQLVRERQQPKRRNQHIGHLTEVKEKVENLPGGKERTERICTFPSTIAKMPKTLEKRLYQGRSHHSRGTYFCQGECQCVPLVKSGFVGRAKFGVMEISRLQYLHFFALGNTEGY